MKRANLLVISILITLFISCEQVKQRERMKEKDEKNKKIKSEIKAKESSFSNRFKDAKLTKSAKELAKGNNQFAVDFYKNLEQSDKNIMFSPLSIYTALGMLYEGADENTAKEINKVLHLEENNYKSPQAFYDLIGTIYNYNKFETISYVYDEEKDEEVDKIIKPYRINLANSLWIDKEFEVKKEYKTNLDKSFRAEINNLDLQDKNTPKVINDWVSTQTRGKIPRIIDSLNDSTRLVLLNAIYFKAPWADEFSEYATEEKKFYLNNGEIIKTDMMSFGEISQKPYYENQFIKVLKLRYEGEFTGIAKDGTHQYKTYAMYFILPQIRNGLRNIEQILNFTQLQNWLDNPKQEEVIVEIPKFKFEFDESIINTLEKLGVQEAFSRKSANFSKINSDITKRLFVSEARHKTFIVVNEKDTEAVAVTEMEADEEGEEEEVVKPKPKEFIANHPFIFVIREEESGAIIFMGRVSNPNES